MGTSLDMDRIAKELGAERRGKVSARGGYFGALEFAGEVAKRFKCGQGEPGANRGDPAESSERSAEFD